MFSTLSAQQIEWVFRQLEKTCFRLNMVAQQGAANAEDMERLENMVKNIQDAITEYKVCPQAFCCNFFV